MSPETLFALAFPLAVPFWLLMIVAPWWSVTRRLVASPLIAVPPLLVYLVGLVPQFAGFWSTMTDPALDGVLALLATPYGAATIWAHFIGFDLFVGRWMFLDARQRRVSGLVMAPILALTVLLSPVGLLSYLVLRYGAELSHCVREPARAADSPVRSHVTASSAPTPRSTSSPTPPPVNPAA